MGRCRRGRTPGNSCPLETSFDWDLITCKVLKSSGERQSYSTAKTWTLPNRIADQSAKSRPIQSKTYIMDRLTAPSTNKQDRRNRRHSDYMVRLLPSLKLVPGILRSHRRDQLRKKRLLTKLDLYLALYFPCNLMIQISSARNCAFIT